MPGSINFEHRAFTWEYPRASEFSFKYGPKGNPGEVRSITLPKLTKKMRLYPNEGGSAGISLEDNPFNMAIYKANNSNATSQQYISVTEKPKNENKYLPTEDTRNETIPDNNRIKPYVDKVKAYGQYGFRNFNSNPFNNCEAGNTCPGYGGYGIFPVLYTNQRGGSITFWNNQPYAKKRGGLDASYSHNFGVQNAAENPEDIDCGYTPDSVKAQRGSVLGRSDYFIGGNSSTPMYYCTKRGHGGGAIVILW